MTWLDTLSRRPDADPSRSESIPASDDVPDQIWEVGRRAHPSVFPGRIRFHRLDVLARPRPACGSIRSRSASLNFAGPASSHAEVLWNSARAALRGRRSLDSLRALHQRLRSCRTASPGGGGVLADGPESSAARVCGRPLQKAISSPIFPIRLGRPTGGMTNTSRWVDRRSRNCRC